MAWEPPADPDLKALLYTAIDSWHRDRPTVIAFDTETTGLGYHDRAFCVTLAWHSNDVVQGPGIYGHYVELDLPDAKSFLATAFQDARVIVGHNIKFDAHRMEAAGIDVRQPWLEWHDTAAMSHLDNEHRPKGLKDLAVSLLGESDTIPVTRKEKGVEVTKMVPRETWEIGKAKDWAKKKYGLTSVRDVGYHLLPRGTVVPYAIKDAVFTLRLAGVLHPRILAHTDLAKLYEREMLLTRTAIYSLERAGMNTRRDYIAAKVKEYQKRCLKHELAIETIVGKPVKTGKMPPKERPNYFNPSSSSPDTGEFLTASGFERKSYDAENLGGIDHPLAKRLLTYRKDRKILDGYFISLQKAVGDDDLFHPSIREHGTVTGRTSAGKERGD